MRPTPESIRRLFAERAYRQMTPQYYPVGLISHEPDLVTGLADDDGDQAEAIGRLVRAADAWTWV